MATCCGIFDAVIFFLGFCVRESVTVVSTDADKSNYLPWSKGREKGIFTGNYSFKQCRIRLLLLKEWVVLFFVGDGCYRTVARAENSCFW